MDNVALFNVRTEAGERIKAAMELHDLPKDKIGGYRYNHAVTFIENIGGVLEDQYFENTTDGMKGLLAEVANELIDFKANVAIRAPEVKAAYRSGGTDQRDRGATHRHEQRRAGRGEPPKRFSLGMRWRQRTDGKRNHREGGGEHNKPHPPSSGRSQIQKGR